MTSFLDETPGFGLDNLPFGVFSRDGDGAPLRDARRRDRRGPRRDRGAPARRAGHVRRAGPQRLHGGREGDVGRRPRPPPGPPRGRRRRGSARRRRPARGRARPARRGHDAPPGRNRRLHGLLLVAPARDERRHHVPRAGERAHAQLAPPARRLPRARVERRRERHAGRAARRPDAARRRGAARLRPEPAARHRARARRLRRAGQRARRAGRHRRRRATTSSATCSSTTGPPATSSGGSTSRSGRSWPRASARAISPWVVPAAALDPFRVDGEPQDASAGNPEPLPYLRQAEPRALDVRPRGPARDRGDARRGTARPRPSRARTRSYLYWSPEQQLAHHTVAGCNLRPGDLLASGTISGDTEDSYGSFLEITWRGTKPVELAVGETRRFLEDGDRVVHRAASPRRDGRSRRASATSRGRSGRRAFRGRRRRNSRRMASRKLCTPSGKRLYISRSVCAAAPTSPRSRDSRTALACTLPPLRFCTTPLRLGDFDYEYPRALIGAVPGRAARGRPPDGRRPRERDRRAPPVSDLPTYFGDGDVLVANDTMVFPARLRGEKEKTGARRRGVPAARAQRRAPPLGRRGRPGAQGARRQPPRLRRGPLGRGHRQHDEPRPHAALHLRRHARGALRRHRPHRRDAHPAVPAPPGRAGRPDPLPDASSRASAAPSSRPTAGLHFTPGLLRALAERGAEVATVTLHTGLGSFEPVEVEDLSKHRMDSERYASRRTRPSRVNRALDEPARRPSRPAARRSSAPSSPRSRPTATSRRAAAGPTSSSTRPTSSTSRAAC